MSAGRICIREVDVIAPGDSTQTAAARMHARKVGTLVVVDNGRRPMGIVTDRDLAVRVVGEARDAATTLVRDVMTAAPQTVYEHTSIEETLRLMRAGRFRRVPVVDIDGRLAGIVSLDDVLDLLAEEFAEIGELLREEAPGSLARA